MKKDILIYGAGLLGHQMYYIIKTYFFDSLNIVGFIDDTKPPDYPVTENVRSVCALEDISKNSRLSPDKVDMVLAIGYSNMKGRHQAFLRAKEMGFFFQSLIHPRATVEKNVELGEGVIVQAGVVLDQYVKVGEINYFDIGVLIGENSQIGSNNYFSAGVTIGGSVQIGTNNFVGLNSTAVNNIKIGDHNFINAQTLIHRSLESNYQLVEIHESRTMRRI